MRHQLAHKNAIFVDSTRRNFAALFTFMLDFGHIPKRRAFGVNKVVLWPESGGKEKRCSARRLSFREVLSSFNMRTGITIFTFVKDQVCIV